MSGRREVLAGLIGAGSVIGGGLLQAAPAEAQGAGVQRRGGGGGGLSNSDVSTIIQHAIAGANATDSGLRSIGGVAQKTKMHIAVVDRAGHLLRLFSMEDAWEGSIDIAIAKARTAAFFSSNENALTSRVIGLLSQAQDPVTGNPPAQPLWGIWASNQVGISGSQSTRNGLIVFPGGVPLYKNDKLVGGVGVSGDGVDQDETVAFAGAVGFEPPANIGQLGFA